MKVRRTFSGGIRRQLLRSHLLLLGTVLGVLLCSSGVLLTWVSARQGTFALQNNAGALAGKLEELVATMESCSNAAMLNLNGVDTLLLGDTQESALEKHNAVSLQLFYVNQVYRGVDSVRFIDAEGDVYASSQAGEAFDPGWYDDFRLRLDAAAGGAVCLGFVQEPGSTENARTLLLGKRIMHIQSGRTLGYLYLGVQGDNVAAMSRDLRFTPGTAFYLCEADTGAVLAAEDVAAVGGSAPGGAWHSDEGVRWLFDGLRPLVGTSLTVAQPAVRVVCLAPASELFAGSLVMFLVVLALGLAGALAAYLLSRYHSNRLAAPIQQLSASMQRVINGDLGARCTAQGSDEAEVLGEGFNQMLDAIEGLIRTVEWEQREKAKIDIALMQNQIKPHFLYNSLNTIHALCALGKTQDAARAAQALSDYYRLTLSGGKNIITLREELAGTQRYLDIQKITYREKLTAAILCDERLGDCMIPKMTVQPIVENALLHGIRPRGGGSVLIEVQAQRGEITIKVADDGAGLKDEQAKGLIDRKSKTGFGLKSVRQRLAACFGRETEVSLASEEGYGTIVTIRFPQREGGEGLDTNDRGR